MPTLVTCLADNVTQVLPENRARIGVILAHRTTSKTIYLSFDGDDGVTDYEGEHPGLPLTDSDLFQLWQPVLGRGILGLSAPIYAFNPDALDDVLLSVQEILRVEPLAAEEEE